MQKWGKKPRKIGWLKAKPEVANAGLYDLPEMTEATIRYYRTVPNRIANCTEQYRDFLRFFNIFFTGQKN